MSDFHDLDSLKQPEPASRAAPLVPESAPKHTPMMQHYPRTTL